MFAAEVNPYLEQHRRFKVVFLLPARNFIHTEGARPESTCTTDGGGRLYESEMSRNVFCLSEIDEGFLPNVLM